MGLKKPTRPLLRSIALSGAIAGSLVAMPLVSLANQSIDIEYTPLGGPTVEASNGWQWHPPMVLPVDVNVRPVSQQVTTPSHLQVPAGMPLVGPSGFEA